MSCPLLGLFLQRRPGSYDMSLGQISRMCSQWYLFVLSGSSRMTWSLMRKRRTSWRTSLTLCRTNRHCSTAKLWTSLRFDTHVLLMYFPWLFCRLPLKCFEVAQLVVFHFCLAGRADLGWDWQETTRASHEKVQQRRSGEDGHEGLSGWIQFRGGRRWGLRFSDIFQAVLERLSTISFPKKRRTFQTWISCF